ncbi:hypothetical protein Tco_1077158 [Tanacetum coccineum]
METGYGITDTWDKIVKAMLKIAPTTLEGVNQRVTELTTTIRQETKEFQVRFEDAQDDRDFLRARVNTYYRGPCQDPGGTGRHVDWLDFIASDTVDYNTWTY